MAMLNASKIKRGVESGVRLPTFVLASDNLDSYRPWLKRLREWTGLAERQDEANCKQETRHVHIEGLEPIPTKWIGNQLCVSDGIVEGRCA